jgi:hypothetical protein
MDPPIAKGEWEVEGEVGRVGTPKRDQVKGYFKNLQAVMYMQATNNAKFDMAWTLLRATK